MSDAADHATAATKDRFYTDRKDPCDCEDGDHHYQKARNEKWFAADPTYLEAGAPRHAEAHHILCCASVEKFKGRNTISRQIIEKTKWCVNIKSNMYGMPLWGHTIHYYCSVSEITGSAAKAMKAIVASLKSGTGPSLGPPAWANIPQHNCDHDKYQSELERSLNRIADRLNRVAVKKHKEAQEELVSELNELASDLLGKLKRRGRRQDGTHEAWTNGPTNKSWYEPFSMADPPRPRTFPGSVGERDISRKIQNLVSYFLEGPS